MSGFEILHKLGEATWGKQRKRFEQRLVLLITILPVIYVLVFFRRRGSELILDLFFLFGFIYNH